MKWIQIVLTLSLMGAVTVSGYIEAKQHVLQQAKEGMLSPYLTQGKAIASEQAAEAAVDKLTPTPLPPDPWSVVPASTPAAAPPSEEPSYAKAEEAPEPDPTEDSLPIIRFTPDTQLSPAAFPEEASSDAGSIKIYQEDSPPEPPEGTEAEPPTPPSDTVATLPADEVDLPASARVNAPEIFGSEEQQAHALEANDGT